MWPLAILLEDTEKLKAGNETSMPPARCREPGKVRAGAGAGVEWTRELQAERGFPRVGFDVRAPLVKPRVSLQDTEAVPE